MKKLSDEQEKEIIEIYTSGETILTTSKKLGISYYAVRKFLVNSKIIRTGSEAQKTAKKRIFSNEEITTIIDCCIYLIHFSKHFISINTFHIYAP